MQSLLSVLTDAAARRLRAAGVREYAGGIKWAVLTILVLQTPAFYDLIWSNALIVYGFFEQNATSMMHFILLFVIFVAGIVESVYDIVYDAELDRQLNAMTTMWGAVVTPPPQPQAPQLAQGDGE